MLCTLLAPTSGSASVAGFDVVAQPGEVRLRIGAALQEAALDPRQTGTELLLLQGRLYGLSRGDARRRVDELGELIDLGDALDRRIATYSGGMKRRLDLAAALDPQPGHPLPRRTDHRSRSREPGGGVGGGSPSEPRPRDDRVPHDAVPRRGRRARRSRRHHRSRPHRRRGHAGRPEASGRLRHDRRTRRRATPEGSARRSNGSTV